MQCEGCPYSGEICTRLERPVGHRWVDSLVKLAKACAWIDGKPEVDFQDALWGIERALPHRMELKQNLFLKYANETEWVNQELMETIRAKQPLWDEAIVVFNEARKGSIEALQKLSKLAEKCLAVKDLYEWAEAQSKKPVKEERLVARIG